MAISDASACVRAIKTETIIIILNTHNMWCANVDPFYYVCTPNGLMAAAYVRNCKYYDAQAGCDIRTMVSHTSPID